MKPPESLDTYEALHFYHHVNVLTTETFEETLRVLEQAVTREPDCGLAWSLLAHPYCMNYILQFSPLKTPLKKALDFAKKAVSLDSQNQQVRATLANLHFRRNEQDLFLLEAEKAMALNPTPPCSLAIWAGSWRSLVSGTGDWPSWGKA
jgi:adenylate cyclase